MNRNEVLKSIGFSDSFLETLDKFEEKYPISDYGQGFNGRISFESIDSSGEIIVKDVNDNYFQNTVISSQ